uniref:Uncharacterized protein n=1 Tax=Neobodo designis TaxID=312471 RepID=A0A7S1QRZ8_NEODS
MHEIHVMALRQQVVKDLDSSITALDEADQKAGGKQPVYKDALKTMRATRDEILPPGMTITGGVDEEAAQKAGDLDGRVDQLLEAYQKRRGSLPADAPAVKA